MKINEENKRYLNMKIGRTEKKRKEKKRKEKKRKEKKRKEKKNLKKYWQQTNKRIR